MLLLQTVSRDQTKLRNLNYNTTLRPGYGRMHIVVASARRRVIVNSCHNLLFSFFVSKIRVNRQRPFVKRLLTQLVKKCVVWSPVYFSPFSLLICSLSQSILETKVNTCHIYDSSFS